MTKPRVFISHDGWRGSARMARAHGLTGAMIGYGAVCVAGTLIAALFVTAFALG